MNTTKGLPCITSSEAQKFSDDYNQHKRNTDSYREYVFQNSFFLRNTFLIGLSFGVALPIVITLATMDLRGLIVAIAYAGVHVFASVKIEATLKEKFTKEHPMMAKIIFAKE